MGLFKLTKTSFAPILVVLLITASCAVKKPVSNEAEPQTEAKVVANISNLPEVVKANVLCKKNSHGSKHLVTYITGRPSDVQSFYTVKVSENNNSPAANVWFSFIVYPKTNKVYFLDTKKAKYIPLVVWRRQKYYKPIN